MGWGNCGTDSRGRPIGYLFPATCDAKGCNAKIDRGLSYACGGMHGEDECSCEGYFCPEHLNNSIIDCEGRVLSICDACADDARTSGLYRDDEEEGCLVSIDRISA